MRVKLDVDFSILSPPRKKLSAIMKTVFQFSLSRPFATERVTAVAWVVAAVAVAVDVPAEELLQVLPLLLKELVGRELIPVIFCWQSSRIIPEMMAVATLKPILSGKIKVSV
jgi:hypothetical protein